MDNDWCIEQYVTLEKSVNQIRRETGLGINTIKRWLRRYNITIRGSDDVIVKYQKSHRLHEHYKWRGKKNNCGYTYIYHPTHPNASKNGYINEHRFIAEQIVGRILKDDELVHHIDMVKSNNDINNLYVCENRKTERRAHASFNRLCRELLDNDIVVFNKETGIYEIR